VLCHSKFRLRGSRTSKIRFRSANRETSWVRGKRRGPRTLDRQVARLSDWAARVGAWISGWSYVAELLMVGREAVEDATQSEVEGVVDLVGGCARSERLSDRGVLLGVGGDH
jgi:hypothetical protein